jgi:hypothetical protein
MLETRLRNYSRYVATLNGKGVSAIATAQYASRSEATGNRKLIANDGGVEYGRFLSNSVPSDRPVLALGRLGATGFIDQKPA